MVVSDRVSVCVHGDDCRAKNPLSRLLAPETADASIVLKDVSI